MSQSIVAIILALIATIAPSLAVYFTWKQQSAKLNEVRVVVNGRLEAALNANEIFKTEIRRLNQSPEVTTPQTEEVPRHPVTIGADGTVAIACHCHPVGATPSAPISSTPESVSVAAAAAAAEAAATAAQKAATAAATAAAAVLEVAAKAAAKIQTDANIADPQRR